MKTNPRCKYCIISQQDIIFFTLRGGRYRGGKGDGAGKKQPAPAPARWNQRRYLIYTATAAFFFS